MARLNEPSVSMDTIDSLRRRFLRQNREIARVNSNQSLRIRGLENECARLLSENLDLRGQILRLEKELEDNSAARIADHALEIKTKLEAQLLEWGCILSSLGQEPPKKRHSSPRTRRIAKARPSFGRSPAQRKSRDAAKDAEATALQEGRLPPIYENKSYPRATMNSEQILALCSEAANSTDSPDLGPPPVSRFVEDEPVKVDSPTKSTGEENVEDDVPPDGDAEPAKAEPSPPPKLDFRRKPSSESEDREKADERSLTVEIRTKNTAAPPNPVVQPVKAGAKRKYGDENENSIPAQGLGKENGAKAGAQNTFSSRDQQKQRAIKTLSANRKDLRGRAAGLRGGPLTTRRPLAAKSTNEDLASPQKLPPKIQTSDDVKAANIEAPKEPPSPEPEATAKKPAPTVEIPKPEPPRPAPAPPTTTTTTTITTVVVLPEPETPIAETPVAIPDTPDRPAQRGVPRDTPPPADISSNGETSRPSRRARAPVSYAEPNLRDKMRRPTKEMLDAVSGEGKYIQRSAPPKADGPTLVPGLSSVAKAKLEGEEEDDDDEESGRRLLAAEAVAKEAARRESVVSPLAQKEQPLPDTLPSSVAMERRQKRTSTAATKEPLVDTADSEQEKVVPKTREAGRKTARANPDYSQDVYDFATSSPATETKETLEGDAGHAKPAINNRPSLRHPRRTSAAPESNSSSLDVVEASAKLRSSTSSRKRSSMALPKKNILPDPDEAEDESTGDNEGSGSASISARDRISRRRSMML